MSSLLIEMRTKDPEVWAHKLEERLEGLDALQKRIDMQGYMDYELAQQAISLEVYEFDGLTRTDFQNPRFRDKTYAMEAVNGFASNLVIAGIAVMAFIVAKILAHVFGMSAGGGGGKSGGGGGGSSFSIPSFTVRTVPLSETIVVYGHNLDKIQDQLRDLPDPVNFHNDIENGSDADRKLTEILRGSTGNPYYSYFLKHNSRWNEVVKKCGGYLPHIKKLVEETGTIVDKIIAKTGDDQSDVAAYIAMKPFDIVSNELRELHEYEKDFNKDARENMHGDISIRDIHRAIGNYNTYSVDASEMETIGKRFKELYDQLSDMAKKAERNELDKSVSLYFRKMSIDFGRIGSFFACWNTALASACDVIKDYVAVCSHPSANADSDTLKELKKALSKTKNFELI